MQKYKHVFKSIEDRDSWSDPKLGVDSIGILTKQELSLAMEDVAMLLLFGGFATHNKIPSFVKERCIIGAMLGKKQELDTFVRQRYIWVSRITGGATANTSSERT